MRRHAVEQRGLIPTFTVQKGLMLRMDVDQAFADGTQRSQLHGQVVHISTAFTRRSDHPANHALLIVVDIERGEQPFKPVTRQVKFCFDHAVALRVANRSDIAPVTEDQPQRTEQDRLTRAGFAGDDVQPRSESDIELIDQRIILYRQPLEHSANRN